MINKLKRAADWVVGTGVDVDSLPLHVWIKDKNGALHKILFNPHEKEGRWLLSEMELKLDDKQVYKYRRLMQDIWYKEGGTEHVLFDWWFKTAPASLCFDKIMEVI